MAESLKKARRDLKEPIWGSYKVLLLLGKDNTTKHVDMGLVHSSAAPDITTLVLNSLRHDGDLESGISPSFLVRNWPAMKERRVSGTTFERRAFTGRSGRVSW